jgi:hypothetical protein
MHPADILTYGHQTMVQSVEGLPESDWNIPGACGYWSVRQIIAHLASHEQLLIEILQSLLDANTPMPLLQQMADPKIDFNDHQVALRNDQTVAQTWAEYDNGRQKSFALFGQIPIKLHRQSGLLAWYGAAYDLEDYLVYSFYAHKREHAAQINAFRDILKQQEITDTYA